MQKYSTSFWISLLVVTAYLFGVSAQAGVIYVKPTGSGAWSGQTTYNDIAAAVSAASPGDEIWIAAGEYTIDSSVELQYKIYGGFAGTESAVTDRAKVPGGKAWEFANVTTLKLGGNIQMFTGKVNVEGCLDGLTLDGDGKTGRALNAATNTTAYKITVSHCIAKNFNSGTDGGAFNVRGGSVVIAYCQITGNIANKGGAGYFDKNVSIHHCEITNNSVPTDQSSYQGSTSGGGGGLLLAPSADVKVYNCYIAGNTASFGGGVFLRTDTKMYNCIIVNNTSSASGSGVCFDGRDANGGKVYNCIIANNISNAVGGAGICFTSTSTGAKKANLINTILYNNTDNASTVVNLGSYVSNGSVAPVINNNIYDADYADPLMGSDNIAETDPTQLFTALASGDYTPPASGFAGLDKGKADGLSFAGNQDYAGNARVQGQGIDIGAYEQVSLMRQLTVNINDQIESSTLQSQEFDVAVGVSGIYSFTLKSGAHSPLVFLAGTKLGVTESGGAYSYTLPGITENATVQIAAFAANVLPVSEDTYQRRNGEISGHYADNTSLGSRGETSGYAMIPLLNFVPTVSQKAAGYNKATLKLVPKETFTIDYTVRQFPSGQFANINVVGAGDYNELMKAPAVGSTQTIVNTANAPSLFDVTDNYVLNAMPAEITLSLIKASNGTTHSFYSLENGNIDYIPVLLFENTSYEITVNATNVTIVSPTLSGGKFTTTGLSQDITFTVEDGYENPVVKVDDVDYTLGAPVNDVYTLSLTGILSNKNVVITASPKSGSSLTDKDADKVSVRYVDGRLLIENAKVGSRIQLSNLAGICLWEQTVSSSSAILDCPLKAGVYLLKTGETTQKILVK